MYRFKAKTQVSRLEYILTLTLIYQLGLLAEMLININIIILLIYNKLYF